MQALQLQPRLRCQIPGAIPAHSTMGFTFLQMEILLRVTQDCILDIIHHIVEIVNRIYQYLYQYQVH